MDATSGATPLYRFAGFEFHASTGELRQHDRTVLLPEQACRVLLALLCADGEVVSREHLRTTLWPGRSYGDFEGGLNTAICRLRQVLDDDGTEPHVIGTLPRRGYRMLVPVERESITGHRGEARVRPPNQDPIWVTVSDVGTEEGTEGPARTPTGRSGPERARRINVVLSVLLVGLSLGGAWLAANPDIRRESALRLRRMVIPIQVLRGKVIRNPIGMTFVRIPAGSFTMGRQKVTPGGVGADTTNARPPHAVILARPFLMQTTEVTVGQFMSFVQATNYRTEGELGNGIFVAKGLRSPVDSAGSLGEVSIKRPNASWRNPYFQQEDDYPVVGVSWNDAQTFVDWLNQADPGKGYRLPTEAEWEYACRAGAAGDEAYGTIHDVAWFFENSRFSAHPVGWKQPNAFGLCDMLGNAFEWCQDWYAPGYPSEAVSDPAGPSWGTLRVIRGGGWRSLCYCDDQPRPTSRWGASPSEARDNLGFRIVAAVGNH